MPTELSVITDQFDQTLLYLEAYAPHSLPLHDSSISVNTPRCPWALSYFWFPKHHALGFRNAPPRRRRVRVRFVIISCVLIVLSCKIFFS